MFLALFFILLTLLKLWLIPYLPLLGDEAYYALWSKHLALCYVDHPPMIAYIYWFINTLFPYNIFAVRTLAIIFLLFSSWLVYLIGKEAFGRKSGITAAIFFSLIPTYLAGGLFLTPEQPLLVFWLISTYLLVKIIKTQQTFYWYLLGVAIGLGCLSKLPMLLILPAILLFLLVSSENRRWLTKKEPYLALIIALIIFSPVVWWNMVHSFPSLLHHGARLSSPHYLTNMLSFLLLQFFMYSPPLFFFTTGYLFYGIWKKPPLIDNKALLLGILSLPGFFAFLCISPLVQIGGHWTSPLYLGLLILLAHRISLLSPAWLHNWRYLANLSIILLLDVLCIAYYAFLFPLPAEIKGKEYSINARLPSFIQSTHSDYLFSNQMGVASLVAFYGHQEVYLPKGYWRQFDLWGQPSLKPGQNILYFAFDDAGMQSKLIPLFKKVSLDEQIRLFAKDSDIPQKTKVFICKNYRGGNLP